MIDNMIDRMRKALLSWCKVYQKAVETGGETKRIVKDLFLESYQQAVNDRFFDTQGTRKLEMGKCKDCRWFCSEREHIVTIKESSGDVIINEVIPSMCQRHTHYERRNEDDWCGEWQDKNDHGYPLVPTIFGNSDDWHRRHKKRGS